MSRVGIPASLLLALAASPARADHGGPLASTPMSPLVTALVAAGLGVAAVLLLIVIVRLIARPPRGGP